MKCCHVTIEQSQHQPYRAAHFLIIVNDPDISHSKFAFMDCAASSGTKDFISSTVAYLLFYLFDRSVPNLIHRTEMFQEGFASRRPYARDIVQYRSHA